MNFTPAQEAAICERGSTLLVAAGAGSGKTRVLTERIIARLSETGEGKATDITRFLIVTFTNAAAKELSARIRLALSDKCAETPDARLFKNLALLPQAKICTIDAFCYDFVKEHAEFLGLPPKVRIADTAEFDVLLTETVETLIEEKMAEFNAEGSAGAGSFFYTVYDMFSGKKNDAPFTETICSLYKDIQNFPSPRAFLENAVMWYTEVAESEEFLDTHFGKTQKDIAVMTVAESISDIMNVLAQSEYDDELYKKFEPLFSRDIDLLHGFSAALDKGYKAAFAFAKSLKFGSARTANMENPDAPILYERRKKALDRVKTLIKTHFCTVPEQIRRSAADSADIVREISDILGRVDARMWEIKKSHGILNFFDIERLTLELLYDDIPTEKESAIAENMASQFDELYIDEYQDINPIQDMIFRALARKNTNGEECSRFLVGDAKQSIYGFRGARPDIFESYRDSFSDLSDSLASRKKIFMANNFRCSENVIDFTNGIFSLVMEHYDDNEKLIYSRVEEHKVTEPCHVILCDTERLETRLAPDRMRAEADVLYSEICTIVGNPLVTGSGGKPYKLSDIAILTGKWDAAKMLEKFFSERGVPVVCEKGESFFERKEIRLAKNLLLAVDNPERDIPLAGALRSAVFGFSDDELVMIRKETERKISLFGSLNAYLDADCDENDPLYRQTLICKIERFLDTLSELRGESRRHSASEFLRILYDKTDLMNLCASSADSGFGALCGEARRKNLLVLYDKARDFDKTVFRGLSAFIDYLEMLESGGDMKSCTDFSGDAIRIMTVHKSKGLEFPVCFLFGADRQKTAPHAKFLLHERFGIAFKLSGFHNIRSVGGENGFVSADTPFRVLMRKICDAEELVEYKRLLYVALTRAKDRLYITASPDKFTKFSESFHAAEPHVLAKDAATFLDFVLAYAASFPQFEALWSDADEEKNVSFSANGKNAGVTFDIRTVICTDEPLKAEMERDRALTASAEPPDGLLVDTLRASLARQKALCGSLAAIPPKLTVSLLKEGLIDYENAESILSSARKLLEMPLFVAENASSTAAEKGTAMHTFLQFCNFERCEKDGAAVHADTLAENGFITSRQRELLDTKRLDEFFCTPVYQKIKSSDKIYRELRFNLKIRADEVLEHVPETGDFVLVQGVIDCFVQNADGSYTVIDFKTDHVFGEDAETILIDRYTNQLALYARAVREMTACDRVNAMIFSFSLMKEIDVAL